MITGRPTLTRGNRLRPLLVPALFAGVFLACSAVLAAAGADGSIDWAHMAMGLFGGLGLVFEGRRQGYRQ